MMGHYESVIYSRVLSVIITTLKSEMIQFEHNEIVTTDIHFTCKNNKL